ncbi:unnamed protein product, partial [Allacma fusca]
TSVKEKAT